jgi:hypothetical protein
MCNVSYGTYNNNMFRLCMCVCARACASALLEENKPVPFRMYLQFFRTKRRLYPSVFSMRNEDYKIVHLLSVFHKVRAFRLRVESIELC